MGGRTPSRGRRNAEARPSSRRRVKPRAVRPPADSARRLHAPDPGGRRRAAEVRSVARGVQFAHAAAESSPYCLSGQTDDVVPVDVADVRDEGRARPNRRRPRRAVRPLECRQPRNLRGCLYRSTSATYVPLLAEGRPSDGVQPPRHHGSLPAARLRPVQTAESPSPPRVGPVGRSTPRPKYFLGSLVLGPLITLMLATTRQDEAGVARAVDLWTGGPAK